MKHLPLVALLVVGVMDHAIGDTFYFERAIYTKCPAGDPPTWTIEGPVLGPWINGTMHANGRMTSAAADGSAFDFATDWTITDDSGATLLAASCTGTSRVQAMPLAPQAPWWENCTIKSGSGKYAPYAGRRMLTSGFAPIAGTCVVNKSFITGYKVVVDQD
jgi:hypothetical protein